MASPFFSTIIPVYNRAEFVCAAIDSALGQTLTDQEIIVVDDGSTDDSADFLRKRYGDRIRLIQQPNAGPGPARNAGIAAACGEYIAFLDSDDRWFPWTLQTYRNVADQHRLPAFITGKHLLFREEGELANVVQTPPRVEAFADYLASSDRWRWWGASSFVIRRDALLAAGAFPDSRMNFEDADLAMRLGVSPGFVHVAEPITFAYREHDANVRHDAAKSLAGLEYQLEAERSGSYPGGSARRVERIRILTTFVRPAALAQLRSGDRRVAWSLYRQTFFWHLRLGRIRFLLVFPSLAAVARASRPC